MLGEENLDIDIVVEGDGIAFAEEFARQAGGTITRHKQFGTSSIYLKSNFKIDIASARRETYPYPGSLPVVSPGTLKDDLFRRDFTINAMAVSINRENFCAVLDYFSGRQDLRKSLVRVMHGKSFLDDPTRILRAVRFEQRYGFRIEPKTLKLLKSAARKGVLSRVEPQRLRDELIPILKEKQPVKAVLRLGELAGFDFIFPGLKLKQDTRKLIFACMKEVSWFKEKYPKKRRLEPWVVFFAGLLEPLKAKDAAAVCRKFALRKGEEKRIIAFKDFPKDGVAHLSKKGMRPAEIFKLLEPLSYETLLVLKAAHKSSVFQKYMEDFLEIYNGMRLYATGDDLRRLGLAPGPRYQKIFTRVLEAKLNGEVKGMKEELEFIRHLIKEK
jgi:tRNA nucleotidyltransferase (CCA-adding enzyme)